MLEVLLEDLGEVRGDERGADLLSLHVVAQKLSTQRVQIDEKHYYPFLILFTIKV